MLTRAKRRMGQRDLWDVIVNNDDDCFKYILPRLNGTDIKFLYDVNGETRALIKRAMASGITLEETFKSRYLRWSLRGITRSGERYVEIDW